MDLLQWFHLHLLNLGFVEIFSFLLTLQTLLSSAAPVLNRTVMCWHYEANSERVGVGVLDVLCILLFSLLALQGKLREGCCCRVLYILILS
jgi:hypothetical protein